MGKMRGRITEIQRFSLNDGDGIRSTVFFAGCNMNCAWCHNPESIPTKPRLMHYAQNCIGCGMCADVCANGVHNLGKMHKITRENCVNCRRCTELCFAGALKMSSREVEVDEIMREVRQDKPYYESSGGGVTLSGGEVMMQPKFAEAVCDACLNEGIKVAIETNLCYDLDIAEPILKKMSLIMFDIKIFDSEEHKKHTGVDNSLILGNVKKLAGLGIPLIARTPLIPMMTDGDENLCAIAEFLRGLPNLKYWELLNFNPLGGVKYDALGLCNKLSGAKPLSQGRLDEIKTKIHGIEVKIG